MFLGAVLIFVLAKVVVALREVFGLTLSEWGREILVRLPAAILTGLGIAVLLAFLWGIGYGFYSYLFQRDKWVLQLSDDGIRCVECYEKWENLVWLGGRRTLCCQRVRLEFFPRGQGPVTIWFLHKLTASECRVIEEFLERLSPPSPRWETFYAFRPYPWSAWLRERRMTMYDIPYNPFKFFRTREPFGE